jgi:hypothetical protein
LSLPENLTCAHCGEPITHSDHPLTKFCNRQDCKRDRDNIQVRKSRAKTKTKIYHCIKCNRSVYLPTNTPRGKRICKHCQKAEEKICSCCGHRKVAPGLRFLCWECYITDGNYDAELQRKDSLDHRYIANG